MFYAFVVSSFVFSLLLFSSRVAFILKISLGTIQGQYTRVEFKKQQSPVCDEWMLYRYVPIDGVRERWDGIAESRYILHAYCTVVGEAIYITPS